jgi:RNase P subunit RPR2
MNLVIETKANPSQAERRRSRRHHLYLDAEAVVAEKILPVRLHELSRSGFLMECTGPLATGEQFEIRLAGSGSYLARAIWTCGSLVGCEFQHVLSPSACSAALLKARPQKPAQTPSWRIDDEAAEANAAPAAEQRSGEGRDVRLVLILSIALWATVALAVTSFLA